MHQGLSPVHETLDLARRMDRLESERLRLWIGDCAWRVLAPREDRHQPPDRPDFVTLARAHEHSDTARFVTLARRYVFAELELDFEELLSLAARARPLGLPPGMRGSDPSPLRRRAPFAYPLQTHTIWAQLADEERWQAQRLLLRLDMLPQPEDVLVALDLAEADGNLPRVPYSRARLEQLRTCVLAGDEPPVELLLEFLEMMFRVQSDHVEPARATPGREPVEP